MMLNLKTKNCINLPKKWKNRVSSILTNKCIMLFTEENCKSGKLKATLIKDKVYFDRYLYWPANLPSYNFNGSR